MWKSAPKLFSTLLAISILFISATAFAQDYNNDDEAAGLTLLSTTTGLTTTIAGGVALTVLLIDRDGSASKEAYIRQNALALQQDMTIGAGHSIEDLAAVFRISKKNLPAFASAVHSHRDQLFALTHVEKLDEQRADKFFQIIATAMRQDPNLRNEWQEITIFMG